MNLINGCYGYGYSGIPTNLIVKELVFNYLGSVDANKYLSTEVEAKALEAADRANEAASLVESIDVVQFQNTLNQYKQDLENQKYDTGITATAKFGGIARTQAEVNANRVHVKDFGVVGDGVTDDTAALVKAITAGVPLDFSDLSCKHTGINLSIDSVRWTGNGATLIQSGTHKPASVELRMEQSGYIRGINFDGKFKANTGLKIVTESDGEVDFILSDVDIKQVLRKDKEFLEDADGLRVAGSFRYVLVDGLSTSDCFIEAAGGDGSSRTASGITTGQSNGLYVKHIGIINTRVHRVWSTDPTEVRMATGIRIFQDMTDENASCYIHNYTCINVSNRAIKLHSSPNTIVDGVHRVLQASVIPQSGAFNNPDIDCQQAGATIKNCHFIYDGAWHEIMINNYSDQADDTRFRAGNTSGITAWIKNAAGNDITVLSLLTPDGTVDAKHQANLSDVNIIGNIRNVVHINLRNEVSSSVNMSNIIASCSSEACRIVGSSTAKLILLANNVINTAVTEVPFASKYSDTYDIETHGVRGFIKKRGYTQAGVKGLGVNGKPNATFDIFALDASSPSVRLNGSTGLSTDDSAYKGWYEWYNQVSNKRLGLIGYTNDSNDLSIINDLDGNINIRTRNFTQVTVSRFAVAFNVAKVSMVNLPTSAAGLIAGELWNDAGTLKIAL